MKKFSREKWCMLVASMACALFASHARCEGAADSSVITHTEPLQLLPQTLQVDPRFSSTFSVPHIVNLPAGFTASVFADKLQGARFMCWSPDSVLYVCAMGAGTIVALPDLNHDGIRDTMIVVDAGLNTAHSLQFFRDTLYVAETGDVLKEIDDNGDRMIDRKESFITGLETGGNHRTRTILFDEPAHKVFVSVGSQSNDGDENISDRACILQFNDDGTGKRIFATGLRNSVGLAFHPVTHALWANNNGFDNDPDKDAPPEVINIINDGDFYGWPLAFGNKLFSPVFPNEAHRQFTHGDSVKVLGMHPPIAQMQAHSAPLGLAFYTGNELPVEYHNCAFNCFHGSWDRAPAVGEKVIRLRGNDDGSNMVQADFMTGWMTDSTNATPQRWGRPVGVIADHRGNIFISDDYAGVIYRVHYTGPPPQDVRGKAALPEEMNVVHVFPDPAMETCSVDIESIRSRVAKVEIVDMRGAIISTTQFHIDAGHSHVALDVSDLSAGAYRVRLAGSAASVAMNIVR